MICCCHLPGLSTQGHEAEQFARLGTDVVQAELQIQLQKAETPHQYLLRACIAKNARHG
jgi:hypothetical protein